MTHRPFRLGLTGSIGMGKSAVAAMARQLRVPVFDADAEVHRLQGPDGALLGAIEARFPGTTGPGGVDRTGLGALVIGHAAEMRALEAIVHPAVVAAQRDFLRRHRGHKLVMFDIPLLFETGAQRRMDAVALVTAPGFVQRRRVLRRAGMTVARFHAIRRAQMPDREKRALSDYLIDTACPKSRTRARLARLLICLRGLPSRTSGPIMNGPTSHG